ncbi:MAG: MBOAT family O-acyltransferase [Smithella sp.]|jgi:D-alanyl-lipoteichoic acid acyltransferase DltB (MBOAT superfamily)
MLFNSFPYIFLFLPVSVIVYFSLNKFSEKAGRYWLVIISLIFYSFGTLSYLPLLLLSIVINYAVGLAIRQNSFSKNIIKSNDKLFLTIGIIFNVGLLAFFKYSDFFITNINQAINLNLKFLHLAIPLAISFYTFQQIAYLVDTYRKEIKDINFLDYCIFVTFFPRLLMGPITRYNEVIPQLQLTDQKRVDYGNMSIGLYLFFIGLCKRVVIADTFGIYADIGYTSTQSLSMIEAWITSFSYTFQIYFDFSGYTDMAIGTAYFFNIKLPFNFNSPYLSVNIQDFWRRWHITLSRFLRDYIYIPLGGNRKGEYFTYINIMITFLIGGFWHGAGWTFIIWGAIHGTALCLQRMWQKFKIKMPKFLAIFITFNVVNVAWIFFRAKSLSDAINVILAMSGFNALRSFLVFEGHNLGRQEGAIALLIISISLLIIFFFKNSNTIPYVFRPSYKKVATVVLIIILGLLFLNSSIPKEFIYNDF